MSDVSTKIGINISASGAGSTRDEIASIYRALREGTTDVKGANAALKEYGRSIRAQNRAISLLRAEYRAQNAGMLEGMRTMTRVASIGRTITSTYQTYTLMQTRVADKTRDVRDTESNLADIQARRMQVVADLGANNAISLRLMNEEERLTKRLTEEKRDLKRAQDQNIIGYGGMALQLVGLIPKTVSAYQSLSSMKTLLGETWTYTGLSGIVTAAGAAKTALSGILTTWGYIGVALAAPLAAKVIVETAMETPYWLGTPEEFPIPPSGGGTPGFDFLGWVGDMFGDGMEGAGLIPEDLVGALMDEIVGVTGQGDYGDYGESTLPGGDGASVTVEGEDIDVQVDVTVTKSSYGGGGESRHR